MGKSSRIELREYEIAPIPKVDLKAVHQYYVKYNERGEISGELHGFATDRSTEQRKTVGSSNDALKAWVFPLPGEPSSLSPESNGFSGLYRIFQHHKIMFEGSEEAVQALWGAAINAAKALNLRDIKYNMVGGQKDEPNVGNSNSMARTFGDIMGFKIEKLSEYTNIGAAKNLLPKTQYPDLYSFGCPTYEDFELTNPTDTLITEAYHTLIHPAERFLESISHAINVPTDQLIGEVPNAINSDNCSMT